MVTSFDRGGRLGRALKGVVDKLDYMLMIMDEIREACEVRRAEFGDRRERPPPPPPSDFLPPDLHHPETILDEIFRITRKKNSQRATEKERERATEKERER